MWAYNSMLKCAVNGRVFFPLTAFQKHSSVSRSSCISAPLQELFTAGRPSVPASVLRPSVQKNIQKRDFHLSRCVQSDINTNLAKDIILFKYDNVKLFKIITLFGIVNYAMFITISLNIYSILTKPTTEEGEQSSGYDNDMNESSTVSLHNSTSIYQETSGTTTSSLSEYTDSESANEAISPSYILTGLCGVTFFLGCAVLAGTWTYCNHMVRYIVLHKCGKKVTVITHGAFGKNRYRTWDLNQVSTRGNRAISSAVLLNAKGKIFSYILDIKGTYTNPQLFDATVGVPRNLK